MIRSLVAGGAGFIGSHLCERLLDSGREVICVDNFFTGRRSNVAHLLDDPNFELIRRDVIEPLYVEVDEIFNLACPASPVHYQHDPIHTLKTSVIGAFNLLGLAKRLGARILQALHGNPLTVYGNGSQTRSFCYVTDLVEGLVALMESEADVTGPINLGNPAEFTVSQLATMVLEKTGSCSRIERRPLPPDDPKRRRPDITQARKRLGWSPKVRLEEGLVKTIDYFAKRTRKQPVIAPVAPRVAVPHIAAG